LNNEKLPRDNEKSTAVKKAAILPRSPSRSGESGREATASKDDRSIGEKTPENGLSSQSDASRKIRPISQFSREGSPQGSSKNVVPTKVEQPLRDNDSAPNADGEESLLAVTKVLSIRQLTSAISVTAEGSGKKASMRDPGGQEAPEGATKIMDVRPLATAVPHESENKIASEEKKVSESPSMEPGPQAIASKGVKTQPTMPQEEVKRSTPHVRAGSTSTNDPAVAAFEEPQMADGGDRTRFFQRPGFAEPAERPKSSSSPKAPPFSTASGEPVSRRDVDPSPGEAQGAKEKVAASLDYVAPVNIAPAPHLAGLNRKPAGNLPAPTNTNSSNSSNSLLMPLVLTLNLCTAALVVVVVAFLVHTMGGLPHVLSLFRR
jgi:hypothetical protein